MVRPPRLADPPREYSMGFMARLFSQLRLYFAELERSVGHPSKVNLATMPTDADVNDLTPGTVYLDTADNTLKVKV